MDNSFIKRIADSGVDTTPVVPQAAPSRITEEPASGPELSTVERMGLALKLNQPEYLALQAAASPYFKPNFDFDISQHPKLYEDLEDAQRDAVQQSLSLEEAQFHRDRALQENKDTAALMAGGKVSAAGMAMLSMLASPTTLIGGVGEYKAVTNLARKSSRLEKFLVGAGVSATTAASITAMQAAGREDIDGEDVLYSALFAGALGGAVSPLQASKFVGALDEDLPITLSSDVVNRTMANMDRALVKRSDLVKNWQADLIARAGNKLSRGDAKTLQADIADLTHKLKVFDEKHATVAGRQSDEFRATVDTFRSKGVSKKNAEAMAREAIAQDRMEIEALLGNAQRKMDNHLVAAQAEADLSRLEQGIFPEALRKQLDEVDAEDIMAPLPPETPAAVTAREVFEAEPSAHAHDMLGRKFAVEETGDAENIRMSTENVYKQVAEEKAAGLLDGTQFENTLTGRLLKKLGLSDFMALYRMKNDTAQFLARHLLEDPSGIGGKRVQSASIMKVVNERRLLDPTGKLWRKSYRGWAQERLGMLDPTKLNKYYGELRDEWNRILYEEMAKMRNAEMNGVEYVAHGNKYIREMVEGIQKQADEVLALGKRADVAGFADITRLKGYVPLRWVGSKINRVVAQGKEDVYKKLLSQGYVNAGIEQDIADKIAAAVFLRKQTTALHLDFNPTRMFSKDSRDALEELLKSGNVSREDIANIMSRIDVKAEEAGKAASARRRTSIDLTVKDAEGHSLMDIVDTDIQTLTTRNAMEISGRAALAAKGIKSDADWQVLRTAALRSAQPDEVDKLANILDSTYQHFLAKPRGGGVNPWARRLQDWATLSFLGMLGFAQTAEFSNVFAAHGVVNTFKQSPKLRQLRAALKAGDTEAAGVLGELKVHLGGIWDEQHLFRPEVRLADSVQEQNRLLRTFDNVQAAAVDTIGYLSGMNQIKTIQQQFTVMMQTDKIFTQLRSGMPTGAMLRRFEDAGFDTKILQKLKKKVDDGTVTFQSNGSVDRLNMDQWDIDLIDSFGAGIHRHTHRIIQYGTGGEDAYWMHPTIGSLLTQFRKFPIVAIEKQMGHALRMQDKESFMQLTYGMSLSTLVALSKAAVMDAGKGDSKRLDKALSTAGLIHASMQYASVLSMLGDGMSFVGNTLGIDTVIPGGARGAGSSPSIPAIDAPWKFLRGATGMLQGVAPWTDKNVTDKDISDLIGGSFLGGTAPAVAVSNLLQRINED